MNTNVFTGILDFLLPTSCCHCRSPVNDSFIPFLCSSCSSDFALIRGPVCPRCGSLFESPETLSHSPLHACASCRQSPPTYDQALSVGYFEGSLREAIHAFKYRPCRSLGKSLGDWMTRHVHLHSGIDIIMPVPLHRTRLKKRGFNQALLLAREVGAAHAIPLSYDNLLRVRPTRPQVELSEEERVRNVAGAFSLKRPEAVNERSVLIIDDVYTTGATVSECAAVLKGEGAARVVALTLARPA